MIEATGVALVTGGAKRIGKAIVQDLAAHGFAVAIHANRSGDEADALAARIKGEGGRAAVVAADLTDMDAVGDLVGRAEAALGPVTLLVNNASLFVDDSVEDFDWVAWDRHFAIHVKTPALLAQNFARALPQGREGLIVNIIDQRVWRPTPRYFSYALSKSALWTQTQMLAQALGPRIRVNAIGPGPTVRSVRQTEEDFQAQIDGLILKAAPGLEEFGRTVRFLFDTPSITGQMIALDGGQHLAWETPDVSESME